MEIEQNRHLSRLIKEIRPSPQAHENLAADPVFSRISAA
jgi:hypothetical protein